jgi:hypothetical protein
MKEAVLQALEAIFELFGDTSDVIQFDQSCLTDNPA